jgi:outer membrane biosynthesis protein TonB
VLYSETDDGVLPPVLVYPQLPIDASPAGIKPGGPYFELLVNEDGTVARVRLMASQARLQDRMMVSAAKAWRFKPATKDGRPVRYLLRTPTTS